jgi:glycosyltransferase involved in cell wall biosynthesis
MLKKFAGTVLWNSPYIIYSPYVPAEEWWGFDEIQNELRDQKVYFLKNIYWSVESKFDTDRIQKWLKQRENPNHSFIWMANTQMEVDLLRSIGLNVFLIHQNSFVDPNLFHIKPIPKVFSAVYNAALMPYKRIELASKVKDVALISRDREIEYYKSIIALGNIHLINKINDDKLQFLDRDKVNEVYAQAYCGLCLSAIEGAMYASLEYLLSGIPIVSTKSIGGRDYFFDRKNSIIVDDDPCEVAEAVDYWVNNWNLTLSLQVRIDAIKRQEIGIERLKILISKILFDNECFVDVDRLYKFSFTNGLARHHPQVDFLRLENERMLGFIG